MNFFSNCYISFCLVFHDNSFAFAGVFRRLGITCTDGEFWAEQRNFVTKHLRLAGYGRQPMEVQIQNELNVLIDIIDKYEGKPVWPGTFLPPSVINVLWTFTAGEQISRNDERLTRLLTLMQQRSKAFDMSGGLLNMMPFLRFIMPEKTNFNLINRFNQELHDFFMATIKEHKLEYTEERSADDLIFAYLKEMNMHEGSPSNFSDLQLIMIMLDIFIAGSQTTSITLDLALMQMALNPDIQKRVHKDIDAVLGDAQLPTLSDKSRLSYIQAVLMEVSRYNTITPITGPRRVMHNTKLGGYDIPKNTTVLIGMQSVHMDKMYWGDPECFRPTRFLDDDNKLCNTERFMTFGQGKRKCLGEALARACLFTFFVGIMQKFTVEIPADSDCKPTKNGLLPGIVISPKPYEVLLRRRA